ncbi:hypothetical protein HK098_007975 [Nowakowskiella sp. JEL0407]|nr:hypothetical protein HK098_007975 [Nowakowskiella sp. JEL0407]
MGNKLIMPSSTTLKVAEAAELSSLKLPSSASLKILSSDSSDEPTLSSSTTISSSVSEASTSSNPALPLVQPQPVVNVWKVRMEAKERAAKEQKSDLILPTPHQQQNGGTDAIDILPSVESKSNHKKDDKKTEKEERLKRLEKERILQEEEEEKDALDGFVKVVSKVKSKRSVRQNKANGDIRRRDGKEKAALPNKPTVATAPTVPTVPETITAAQNDNKLLSHTSESTSSFKDDASQSKKSDGKPSKTPAKIIVSNTRSENIPRTETASIISNDNDIWPTLGSEPQPQQQQSTQHQPAPAQKSTSETPKASSSKSKTYVALDLTTPPETTNKDKRPPRPNRNSTRTPRNTKTRASFSAHQQQQHYNSNPVPYNYSHRSSEGNVLNRRSDYVNGYAPTIFPPFGMMNDAFIDPSTADMETVRFWIRQQIEFYFSIENLCRDLYFRKQMNPQGAVSLGVILNFPRMRNLLSLAKAKHIQFIPPVHAPVSQTFEIPSPSINGLPNGAVLTNGHVVSSTGEYANGLSSEPVVTEPVVYSDVSRKQETDTAGWVLELVKGSIGNSENVEILNGEKESVDEVYLRKKEGWEYWILN